MGLRRSRVYGTRRHLARRFLGRRTAAAWAVAASAGVIPRSCVEIFRVLDERAALNSYEVELSMYELYRDALRDRNDGDTAR